MLSRAFFYSHVRIFSIITLLCLGGQQLATAQISLEAAITEIQDYYGVYVLYNAVILQDKQVKDNQDFSDDAHTSLKKVLKPFNLAVQEIGENLYAIIQEAKRGTIKGVVKDLYGNPLSKATIYFPHLKKGTYADINGAFEIEVSVGEHILECSYVGFQKKKLKVEIKKDYTEEIVVVLNESQLLNQVVVVGTVMSPQKSFSKTVSTEVLPMNGTSLPQYADLNQTLNYAVPSFYSVEQSISDGTDHVKPISFKGLDPGKVMVLINGKKRHHTGLVHVNGTAGRGTVGVDLSAIPQSMIQTVEILKNEASSIYGSEAIAGIVNFKLKENTQQTELRSTMGIAQAGDGFSWSGNCNVGMGLKKSGFLNLNLDFRLEDPINRSGAYTGIIYGDERDDDQEVRKSFFDDVGLGGSRVMRVGKAGSSHLGAFYNTGFSLKKNMKFYSFGGFSYKRSTSSGFYRFPYQRIKQSGFYNNGFLPNLTAQVLDVSMVLGLKGDARGWQYDFSQSYGRNHINFLVQNSNNASLGLDSPTEAHSGSFIYFHNILDSDIRRKFEKVPLSLSITTQLRFEGFEQREGELASYINGGALTVDGLPKESGIQVYPGFQPQNNVDRLRTVFSISSGMEYEMGQRWRFNLHSRLSYNEEFGLNWGARLSSRFEIAKNHILRGGVSRGFMLPAMPQLYRGNQSSQFILETNRAENVRITHLNATNPIRKELQVSDLRPERTASVDLEYAMLFEDNLSLSLSGYILQVEDKIVLTSLIKKDFSSKVAAILEPYEIEAVQLFANATNTLTKGLEFSGQYRRQLGKWRYYGRLTASLFHTKVDTDASGNKKLYFSPILDPIQNQVFTREEVARIEYSQPNTGLSLTNTLHYKNWSFLFRGTRFGKVRYLHPMDGEASNWLPNAFTGQVESRDQDFSEKWIFDAELTYLHNQFFEIKLGANNIFNTFPDQIHHSAETNDGIFKYSRRVQQFGVMGAYYYSSFCLTF